MSIADHFDNIPDAGMVRDYDARSARRQFNVSLIVVVTLALAASALGFVVRFDQPKDIATDVVVGHSVAAPAFAGSLSH